MMEFFLCMTKVVKQLLEWMDVKAVLWIASSNHELSLFKKYSFFDLIQKTTQKKYYKTRNHFLHDHVQQTQKSC